MCDWSVMFFPLRTACRRYIEQQNTRFSNSQPLTTANSLSQCQQACDDNTGCTGFDYRPNSNKGQRCLLGLFGSTQTTQQNGVTHFTPNRNCPRTYAILLLYCLICDRRFNTKDFNAEIHNSSHLFWTRMQIQMYAFVVLQQIAEMRKVISVRTELSIVPFYAYVVGN